MIYERITKGFLGRYVFYLSVFVAVYFLMRNAIDSALYSLGILFFGQLEGCHILIAWFVLICLIIEPIFRIYNKKDSAVNQALLAFVLIPVAVWYTIQLFGTLDEKYILFDLLYIFILSITLVYSSIILFESRSKRHVKNQNRSPLLKDEPINGDIDDEDELGFTMYADSISNNIKAIAGNEKSYVFGIEGKWGSGKTSLINLVKARLKKHKEIHIVDFNPWMSNGSKQMTSDFFNRMTEEVSDLRLKAKFREYGKVLANVDGTGIIGKALDWLFPEPDLGTMLESINGCIKRQDLRFVVFIDDMDRLDKEELLAVLKMVRNTASFYQTVFVLMYDRDYVDAQLKVYFVDENVSSSYVDKIVNFQFDVPDSNSNFFRILKDKCNRLPVVLENPEVRLQDDDIPENIKILFDNYRKVKRVFNLLVLESAFPHFEKIPVKDMLVFFYISYYRKEEYEMIKYAYNNRELFELFEWFSTIGKANLSTGQTMLRVIESKNGIIEPNSEIQKSDDEINRKSYNDFKRNNACMYYLLSRTKYNPFVKYLEFLFKFNAIHYKEYKVRYDTYGIDGYKGIEIKLSKAENILQRLIVIRDKFPKTFYEGSCLELIELFTRGSEKRVEQEYLYNYYEFLFLLLLNSSNSSNYLGIVMSMINEHYADYPNEKVNLVSILDSIEGIRKSDNHSDYYTHFSNDERYNFVSSIYQTILRNLIYKKYIIPYNKSEILVAANKHLQKTIKAKLRYNTVQNAFYACCENIEDVGDKVILNSKSCYKFRKYIESNNDEFIQNCIQHIPGNSEYEIAFTPFLMQIFFNDKIQVRSYFIKVKCSDPKYNVILEVANKYLNRYLSPKGQSIIPNVLVREEDFEKLFKFEGSNNLKWFLD